MADVGLNARSLHAAAIAGGSVGDFIALMKPRVMSLVVFTAFTGMVIAPSGLHPALAASRCFASPWAPARRAR